MLTIPFTKGSCFGKRKGLESHDEYLSRIKKSLYYVHLPKTYCTSLPCTELAAEIFSEINKFSLDYLDIEEAAKLSHNACVSPCSLVLALLYLDRLKSTNPKYLTTVSPSELFLISLMVGSKFLQDDGEEDEVNNYEWAASAGVNIKDLNRAEKQFLDAIKWQIFVSEGEFWHRFHILECKLGFRQGIRRGWFTYTELHLLLELIDVTNLIQTFCTVTTACLTSYTASMLTLLGSVLLVGQIPGLGLKAKPQALDGGGGGGHAWSNNISSVNLTRELLVETKMEGRPDATLPPVVRLMEFEMANTLNSCSHLYDFNEAPHGPDCVNLNSLHLFLNLSPAKSVLHSLAGELADGGGGGGGGGGGTAGHVLTTSDSIWSWTDIIGNYLLINSVPNTLLSMANY